MFTDTHCHLNFSVFDNDRCEDRFHLFALLAIGIWGTLLRMVYLFQSIRWDEAYTFLNFVSKPLKNGLSEYPCPNNHLFYTFLAHIAYLIFGNQEWVVRLPAFISGVAIIFLVYLTTRILYNKFAAILASGIVASSSVWIEFSTNARGYTTVAALFLVILFLAAYLKKNNRLLMWFFFSIISALGFYTIPIMLLPFGGVILWLLFSILSKDLGNDIKLNLRNLFLALTVTVFFTIVLYLPVFLHEGISAVIANQWVSTQPWVSIAPWKFYYSKLPAYFFSVVSMWHRDVPFAMSVFLALGFIISLIFHWRMSKFRISFVVILVVWCALLFIIRKRVGYERTLLFFSLVYILAASAGVNFLMNFSEFTKWRSVVYSVLAMAVSLCMGFNVLHNQSVLYSTDTGLFKNGREVAQFLKSKLQLQDRVLADGYAEIPLYYYFVKYKINVTNLISNISDDVALYPFLYGSNRLEAINSCKRIILVVDNVSEEARTPEKILEVFYKQFGIKIDNFSSPRLIKQYDQAALFEMCKR